MDIIAIINIIRHHDNNIVSGCHTIITMDYCIYNERQYAKKSTGRYLTNTLAISNNQQTKKDGGISGKKINTSLKSVKCGMVACWAYQTNDQPKEYPNNIQLEVDWFLDIVWQNCLDNKILFNKHAVQSPKWIPNGFVSSWNSNRLSPPHQLTVVATSPSNIQTMTWSSSRSVVWTPPWSWK